MTALTLYLSREAVLIFYSKKTEKASVYAAAKSLLSYSLSQTTGKTSTNRSSGCNVIDTLVSVRCYKCFIPTSNFTIRQFWMGSGYSINLQLQEIADKWLRAVPCIIQQHISKLPSLTHWSSRVASLDIGGTVV